jgi:endogenous inhibitor of DNA gyrase (YacG/DUF329 family)
MIEIPDRYECFNCGGTTNKKEEYYYEDIIFCSEECKDDYINWKHNNDSPIDGDSDDDDD